MSTPVKLRLYCSICARNDFYMDRASGPLPTVSAWTTLWRKSQTTM